MKKEDRKALLRYAEALNSFGKELLCPIWSIEYGVNEGVACRCCGKRHDCRVITTSAGIASLPSILWLESASNTT